MSLDDLRDSYKSLKQSSDFKLKLNGATYRKARGNLNLKKFGNSIVLKRSGSYNGELDELNAKYDLDFIAKWDKNIAYSLNKKKRWELGNELMKEMPDFARDDLDVRLYETRNRNEKKANCVAVHNTKGDRVEVKKTFANLDSIKKAQELQESAKIDGSEKSETSSKNPHIPKKDRKCSKPGQAASKKSNKYEPKEVIVIDVAKDKAERISQSYAQYEIEYAPKKDVFKYGMPLNTAVEKKTSKATKTTKFTKRSLLDEHASDVDDDDYDEDEEDEGVVDGRAKNESREKFNIGLDDLIDQHLIKTAERNSLKEFNKGQLKTPFEDDLKLTMSSGKQIIY